jgi:60 kDa SS-A/Ro ribonucleoprotein
MRTNIGKPLFTHEGAKSTPVNAYKQLKRSVMACMLWEDNFYEDGKSIVERIEELADKCDQLQVLNLALEAHDKGFLRHVPLMLIVCALKNTKKARFAKKEIGIAGYIDKICSRPDQMTELLSLYWKENKKKALPAQLKKGLAKAFRKFDAYQLAKYNRDNPVKLRDVLFLCHAKAKDPEQDAMWKQLITNTLPIPETWETKLSSGEDKKESFKELLFKGKMGKLAILRNLRNMRESGLTKQEVETELCKRGRPLLPFQFLMAAQAVPQWEDIIDKAMIASMDGKPKMSGMTVVFVDVSGSMYGGTVSAKSQVRLQDAASGIAILLREVCTDYEFFTFSHHLAVIPPRQGMALRDAIDKSQGHSGTALGASLSLFESKRNNIKIDRIIVITDEQHSDRLPRMNIDKCYIINVSNCKNGIGNKGQWTTISGFSENVIDYIQEIEKDDCK